MVNDREIIEHRMSVYGLRKEMNEFFLKLPDPDDNSEDFNSYATPRNILKWLGKWDVPFKDHKIVSPAYFSDALRCQTPREFFIGTIDKSLVEQGLPIDEIKRLKSLHIRDQLTGVGEDPVDALNQLSLPTFWELIDMGYFFTELSN